MDTDFAKLSIADRKMMKPAMQFVSKDKGITGAYALSVKPGTIVYRYDVQIVKQHSTDATKNKLVTKPAGDE